MLKKVKENDPDVHQNPYHILPLSFVICVIFLRNKHRDRGGKHNPLGGGIKSTCGKCGMENRTQNLKTKDFSWMIDHLHFRLSVLRWRHILAELTEGSPVMLHWSRSVSSTTVSPSKWLKHGEELQLTAKTQKHTVTKKHTLKLVPLDEKHIRYLNLFWTMLKWTF